jgi:hypothetical protein
MVFASWSFKRSSSGSGTVLGTTSFTPPFGEGSKISNSLRASDLAWLPPTVHGNCSEWLWLHARAILVALENYSGWLGESNQSNLELATYASLIYASLFSLLCLCLYQSTNTTLSLQLPIKFGNIVPVETPRYLTKITTLQRKADCKGSCS